MLTVRVEFGEDRGDFGVGLDHGGVHFGSLEGHFVLDGFEFGGQIGVVLEDFDPRGLVLLPIAGHGTIVQGRLRREGRRVR